MPSRPRRLARRTLLVVVALLYAASIPWYRSGATPPSLWAGLPDWVAVALGAYVAAAVLTSLAWLLTDIPEDEGDH